MNLETLTEFFLFCVVLNGILLVFMTIFLVAAPGFVYRLQTNWFPMSRETYNILMFSFLGVFKVFWIVLNVVPYFALLIVE